MADLQAIEAEMNRRGLMPSQQPKKSGFTIDELRAQEDFNPDPFTQNYDSQDGTLSRMGHGAVNAMKQRALGLAQIAMEATGNENTDAYKTMQDLATQYAAQQQGLGGAGLVGSIAGDPLTAATLALPAGSLIKIASSGAVAGGAGGITQPTQKGESRGMNALAGTVTGGVAGGVLGAAGQKIGGFTGKVGDKAVDVASTAAKGIRDAAKMAFGASDDKLGVLAAEIRSGVTTPADALKAVEELGKEATDMVNQGVKSGLSPEMALLNTKAKSEGISLTADILTQNPKLQAMVDAARQGALGDDAYKIVRELDATNKANFAAWRDKLGNLIAAGDNAGMASIPLKELNETSVASQIGEAVRNRALELKIPAQEAYKAGLETKSKVMIDEFKRFVPEMSSSLRAEGFDVAAMPTLQKQFGTINKAMDVFGKRNAQIGYKELEVFKKRLYQAAQSASTPSEKLALDKLHGAYRAKLDNIIENDLLINPDEAAKTLRQAPALWREYQQTIFGKDGKNAIGAIVEKGLNDRAIANIFGSSPSGTATATKAIRELTNAIGKDAPELGNLRAQFFNRIIGGGLGESAADVTAQNYGAKVFSNVQKFKSANKELYDELFTPAMQEGIDDFANTLKVYVTKQKSTVNPSNTAIMQQHLQNGMNRMLSRFGMTGEVLGGIMQTIGGDIAKASDEKAVIQAITEPLKATGQGSTILNALGAQGGRVLGTTVGATAPQKMVQPLPDVPEFVVPEQNMPKSGMDLNAIEEEMRRRGINLDNAPQGNAGNDTLSTDMPEMLQQQEGLRHAAYNDTKGNRTIGYGFNMDSGIGRKVWQRAGIQTPFDDVYQGKAAISDADANRLGHASYNIAFEDAAAIFPEFGNMGASRQEALVNLSYHHGRPGLMRKTDFVAAVNKGDFNKAVIALNKSGYMAQFPDRGRAIAKMLLSKS